MKVGIIGRGAIGSLYGMQFYQALKEDFCFIVDAQRKKQYTSQPFLCNGKEVHFPYQVDIIDGEKKNIYDDGNNNVVNVIGVKFALL